MGQNRRRGSLDPFHTNKAPHFEIIHEYCLQRRFYIYPEPEIFCNVVERQRGSENGENRGMDEVLASKSINDTNAIESIYSFFKKW